MVIKNPFKKEPPPPLPFYKRQPIATWAVVLTMVSMFVLGPIGYIFNGFTEELKDVKEKVAAVEKEKVDNENLKETLTELKEQRAETKEVLEQQNESIRTNQMAIQEILIRQEMITPPSGLSILAPKPASKEAPANTNTVMPKTVTIKEKKTLPPEYFERYLDMTPERQERYKVYLERRGYDVEGL